MYKTDVILDAVSVQVHDKTAFDMRGLSRRSTVEGKQEEPNANPEIWPAQRIWLIRQAVEVLRGVRRAISAATALDVRERRLRALLMSPRQSCRMATYNQVMVGCLHL
jgi:hypothetical protein